MAKFNVLSSVFLVLFVSTLFSLMSGVPLALESNEESFSPARRSSALTSDFLKREALIDRIAQRKRNLADLLEVRKAKKEKRADQASASNHGSLVVDGSNHLNDNQRRQQVSGSISAAAGAAILQNAVSEVVAAIVLQMQQASQLLPVGANACGPTRTVCPTAYNGVGTPICTNGQCGLSCPNGAAPVGSPNFQYCMQ